MAAHRAECAENPLVSERGPRRGTPRRPSLLVDGDRHTMTALATAVREDLLAAGGRHAGAEAVSAKAAKVVGLIRALHDGGREKSIETRLRQARRQENGGSSSLAFLALGHGAGLGCMPHP